MLYVQGEFRGNFKTLGSEKTVSRVSQDVPMSCAVCFLGAVMIWEGARSRQN